MNDRPVRLRERFFFAGLVYAAYFLLYGLCNRLVPLAWCRDLTIGPDRAIPFVPAFVFFFYFTYGLILLPAFLVRDRVLFLRSAWAFFFLILASCLLFFVFPVHVPRPDLVPDTLRGHLVRLLYESDRPVCGFPSLHVSASVLAAAILFRERRLWGWIVLPFAVATSLSTLFVKQHVILDVVGGIAIALAVYAGFIRSRGRRNRPERARPDGPQSAPPDRT